MVWALYATSLIQVLATPVVAITLTLLALDERRIDAIRYYDHWIGLIRKELGISPLPATRAIIEEIRNLHNAENAQHLRARLIGRDEKQIFAV